MIWNSDYVFFEQSTPKDRGELGYGYTCPYCRVPQDEGNQTGVYFKKEPVCKHCAPVLSARRRAAGGLG